MILKKVKRNRDKFNLEMILRMTLADTLKDYGKHSSVGGVRQMCNPKLNFCQRLVWTAVFCTAFVTVGYFLLHTWSDTLNKPLIVTMVSSTYPISQIEFPAVALCNINRISRKAATVFAREEFPDLVNDTRKFAMAEWLTLQWGRLLDYTYNDSLRTNPLFMRMVEKYRLKSQQMLTIMKRLAPDCNEMLLRCAWGGREIDCKKLFAVRRTAHGYCCIFNYISDYDSVGRPNRTIAEAKHQTEPGYLYGLNLIADPLLDDYTYPLNSRQGFEVLLFDPTHFADPSAGRVIQRISDPNKAVFFEITSTRQIATKEVRKYSVNTRKCLFAYERFEQFKGMYSYSACIVHCRMIAVQSLCKCTPFFMANSRTSNASVCTLEHLRCLSKYKEKLYYLYPKDAETSHGLEEEIQDSLFCDECLPDCELTQHFTKSFETSIRAEHIPGKNVKNLFFDDINITDKCFISIYHHTPDSTLDRLDVVYYWFEILSNIGGFGGIIVGLSIISAVEIIYFLTIQYWRRFYQNYNKIYK